MTDYSLTIHDDEAWLGNKEASLVLIEYGDYECPYSRMGYRFVQRILRDHEDELCFIFRHFPIRHKHPNAEMCAEAALAAGKQDKFWELHDLMFQNNRKLSRDAIDRWADDLGLDLYTFRMDLEMNTFRDRVQQDYRSGVKHGVDDTPTFFLNKNKYEGQLELNALKNFILESSS